MTMVKEGNVNVSMAVVPSDWLAEMREGLNEVFNLIKKEKEEELASEWIESVKARQMLGISAKTWQTYRDERVIPFSQFGRKIFVKRQDLEDFMEANYIQAKK